MTRQRFYFFLLIAVVLGIVSFNLYVDQKLVRKNKRIPQPTEISAFIKPVPVVKPKKAEKQTRSEKKVSPEFLVQFSKEAGEMSRTQVDVDEVEKRLQSWARHLTSEEISFLSDVIIDHDRRGDERALAIDLLGRNQSAESLTQLKEFVLSEKATDLDSRARLDEEVIFKVQAVEGIAANPSRSEAISYLNEIQKKSDQSFVRDRVQRSLSSLNEINPSPAVQDEDAQKKILE